MPPAITAKEECMHGHATCQVITAIFLPLLRREEELEESGGEKGVGQRN